MTSQNALGLCPDYPAGHGKATKHNPASQNLQPVPCQYAAI